MAKKKGGNISNANKRKKERQIENKKQNDLSKSTTPTPFVVASILGVVIAVYAAYSRQQYATSSIVNQQCGLYIAKSSLPNAGLGMFTGRPYSNQEPLGLDHIVPIFDLDEHQGTGWPFVWRSYTWNPDATSVQREARGVQLTNHGFGSTANAHMDLWNTKMESTEKVYSQKNDGASSPYHQHITALEDLQAGQELFMNYGDQWFIKRTRFMGLIPLAGDVHRADALLQKWNALRETYSLSTAAFTDFWERFVWKNPYEEKSRILAALPQNWTKLDDAIDRTSLKRHLQHETIRSIEWLEENGVCADNLKASPSPISGRGAFATRFLAQNSTVATMPLIHVPFRSRLAMRAPPHHQLLLNYCFGHSQSTLVLCPYGPGTSFVNHDSKNPNVKIVWGNPKTSSSHHPDWLDLSVNSLHQTHQRAGLAFELIALRDISAGEEVLLDYGDEWDAAWRRHVATHGLSLMDNNGEARPYSSALHAPNAFRHDIRIPDEMFPAAWKNQPAGL